MSLQNLLVKLNHRNTRLFPKLSTLSWSLIIALFVFTGTFITQSLTAQAEPADIITQYSQTIEEGNPNLENWVSSNMDNTILKTLDTLVGTKNIADSINNPETSFVPGGAIGTTTNLIAALYTPPASGIEYLAQVKDNFLGKPAYAQGAGFSGLQPLLPLWKGFRNIVYSLSAIIFVILGILVMFRVKTGPQTVITIQTAIPKIITTLILVTFSYAIAGLLIDLMNLIQALSLSVLFSANGTSLSSDLFPPKAVGKFWEWLSQTAGGNYQFYNFSQLASADRWQTLKLLNLALPQTMILMISVLTGGFVGAILGGPLPIPGARVGGFLIGTALIFLIIQIFVLIKLIQFVFGLAKTYLNVILKIILGPLEIGLGSFPGVKIGFGSWITGLAINLSVFPISFLFLVMLNLIIFQIQKSGDLWAPGMLTGVAGITRAVIGFAGILLVSKLPDLIPQVIFQIKPSPFGTAIGESLKTASPFVFVGRAAEQYKNWTTLTGSDIYKNTRDKIKSAAQTKQASQTINQSQTTLAQPLSNTSNTGIPKPKP
ncbi:hypothetical protein KJ909_01365 [Patescibacteria group bacterium]|nr:hypothetical protein [Patescibacteria group bacterium]